MGMEVLAARWGYLVAAGIAMVLLGTLSVAFAEAAGTALMTLFGWLLLIGGAVQLLGAVRTRAWSGGTMSTLAAALRVAVGLLFLLAPGAFANLFVTLVGLYLLVDGVFRVLLALQIRPAKGWTYILTAGCTALFLGVLLVGHLAGEGAFVIGVLFGLHLLLDGWATIMLAAVARASAR
jgi:uncharacterized membrane protein HdeD (DUF308 family)